MHPSRVNSLMNIFEPVCPGKRHLRKKQTSLAAMRPFQWDLNLDSSDLKPGFNLGISTILQSSLPSAAGRFQ